MTNNNITSIDNLINSNQEDEDRKFLRAAAEAIVATSMNSEIDPTILELLRRIQYANAPNPAGATTSGGGGKSQASSNALGVQDIPPNAINNFLNPNTNSAESSIINPARNSHHFPTFNLNYFENLAEQTNIQNNDKPIGPRTNKITSTIASTPTTTIAQDWSLPTGTGASHSRSGSVSASSSSGETKPFICQDCSLSFRRSSDLRRHQRAHLPILPHICKMCGKGFARKDALKRHSDTLTCKRNREKLLGNGGDVESILAEAKKMGHDV